MTLTGILSIVLVLGACVLFHEAGHFILAKLSGMRVDEFAAGFGQRLVGFKYGETEYRINLIPLGGYVKIAGMEPGEAEVERGFYTFPRWQGATVLVAGSVMNVILAALAFTVITVAQGVPVFPDRAVEITKVMPDSAASEAGIQAGDEIVAIDGVRTTLFVEDVTPDGPADEAGMQPYTWLYKRGKDDLTAPGDLLRIMQQPAATTEETAPESPESEPAPPNTVTVEAAMFDSNGDLITTRQLHLPIAKDIPADWTEAEAGPILERALGCSFLPLDHGSVASYIASRPDQEVTVIVLRDGAELEFTVKPRPQWARVMTEDDRGRIASSHEKVGRIGVVISGRKEPVPLHKAALLGMEQSWDAVVMVYDGLTMMIKGDIAPEASGPIGIAAMTADRAEMGWAAVVSLGAIISANLAVINMFPIPPFDGFRLVLLGVEGIIRRRVNAKVELYMTISGVAAILGIFLVITFRDIFNLMLYNTP
jgi:regulator of sigma E protease